MTGAFLRVNRGGRWAHVEVENLTDAERQLLFSHRTQEELVRWMNLLSKNLVEAECLLESANGFIKETGETE